MKILTLIKIVAIATLFSSSTSYATESYSAIAVTASYRYDYVGGFAYGSAVGFSSQNNADVTALNECHSRRKGQCSIMNRFSGPGCIAVAKGNKGAGGWYAAYGWDKNRLAAQTEAIDACHGNYGNYDYVQSGCRLQNIDCTDS